MKSVVHIITTIARGGAENQLKVVVREQVKSDFKVYVIYLKDKPELKHELQSIGAEVLDFLDGKNFIAQTRILKNFLSNFPGVIHAHLPRAELLAAVASPKGSLIVSRHNAEPFFPNAPALISKILSRQVERRAILVIAISEAVKRYLLESGEIADSKKIEVVHYGFDKNLKVTTTTQREKNAEFVIGTVGRLAQQKDYPTLFAAFKLFLAENPSSKLLVIGGGSLKEELQELAQKLGVQERIIWFGRTNDVISAMRQMDIFVLASKYEGFGLVLLEAIQTGVPVIAANNSAIPEVLGENSNALFQTGNAEDLYSKMKEFKDRSKRNNLIEAQHARLSIFSPESMITKMNSAYNRILVRS